MQYDTSSFGITTNVTDGTPIIREHVAELAEPPSVLWDAKLESKKIQKKMPLAD